MLFRSLSPRPAAAAYVAIDTDKPEALIAEPYEQWIDALEQRLSEDLQRIAAGAPLPAVGVDSTCQYCDVRGLCRKGVW